MSDSAVKTKTVWLIVEDDMSIRQMLSAMIGLWGHIPLSFADGFKAMAWLDDVESGRSNDPVPELAILDIRMPGPQGHEIGQRLRKLAQTRNTPIVIMTAFRFDGDERKLIDDMARPDAFLAKPLPTPDDLRTLFEGLLERAREEHARANAAASAGPQNVPAEPAKPTPPHWAAPAPVPASPAFKPTEPPKPTPPVSPPPSTGAPPGVPNKPVGPPQPPPPARPILKPAEPPKPTPPPANPFPRPAEPPKPTSPASPPPNTNADPGLKDKPGG